MRQARRGLMGGWSSSVRLAVSLASTRRRSRTRIESPSIAACSPSCKPDVAFNALHGPFGEDGTIQGILEVLRHSLHPLRRARLGARHEQAQGQASCCKAAGIPVAEQSRGQPLRGGATAMSWQPPYVVKPIAGGSSFGVVIVREDRHATRRRNCCARTGPTATS